MRNELGAAGNGEGSVDLFLGASGFVGEASYRLPSTVWFLNALNQNTPNPDKAALGFKGMTLRVTVTPSTGLGLSFDANGQVSLPAPTASTGGSGKGSIANVSLAVGITLGATPRLSVAANIGHESAGSEPCDRAKAENGGITNAFGADGFDICQLAFNGSIGLRGFSLGVAASFTLPTSWEPELGVYKGTSLRIGFNISAHNPCLDLAIDQAPGSADPAVDLLKKGAIIANSAALEIAPSGCSLPSGRSLHPGIRFAFSGTMFGTRTDINLEIKRKDAGLAIRFTQRTGASSLGPLNFGATNIRVLLDAPQTELEVHTSMAIGGAGGIRIDGSFKHSGDTTTLDASTCTISTIDTNAPPEQTQRCEAQPISFFGATLRGAIHLSFSATGPQSKREYKARFNGDMNLNLKILSIGVKVNELTYDNTVKPPKSPGLQVLDIAVNTGFKLGPVEGHIGGSVKWANGAPAINLGLHGHLKLWGFEPSFKLEGAIPTKLPFGFGAGEHTTRISQPGKLVVYRLEGDLKADVNSDGQVKVEKVMPIQVCFPFETVCVKVGDATVNAENGEVKFKDPLFGNEVKIEAKNYFNDPRGQVDYSPGISYLINQNSGKCLDVPFADFHDGQRLWQIGCHQQRHHAQEFRLLRDGTLRMRNGQGREFCVSAQSVTVELASCGDNPANYLRWFRDDQGRIHTVDKNFSPGCLDVATGSKDGEARIGFYPCNSHESQRWVMAGELRTGAGCLDVPRGNLNSDLKVFPTCNKMENQAFALYPNGELKVRGQCVAATANRDGVAVKLADCNHTFEQLWFLHNGRVCIGQDGRFGPLPGGASKCLTAEAKLVDHFYSVKVTNFNDATTSHWDVTY